MNAILLSDTKKLKRGPTKVISTVLCVECL